MPVSIGERPKERSKRCILRELLQITFEVAERTDSGRWFQREGAQEWKNLALVLALTLGIIIVIPLFDHSNQDGSDVASRKRR